MAQAIPREFLIVAVGGQHFGIDTLRVETVVAGLPLTPLPFVPPHVEGLVSINERIVPCIGLQRLLGCEGEGEAGGKELVLVETARAPCALRVGRIVGKAVVEPASLEPLAAAEDNVAVRARFAWQEQSVLVLDIDQVGATVVAGDLPQGQRGLLGRHQAEAQATQEQSLDCIVVAVGGERYAIALADMVEILDLPPATPVPGAPAVVEGLGVVRDDVLLVLALARLLRQRVDRTRAVAGNVVVVLRDGLRYGLRVDSVEGIRQMQDEQLRRIEDADSEVGGILADGGAVIGLLDPVRLIDDERHRHLRCFVPERRQQAARAEEEQHVLLQVALGEEIFALPLAQVRRIAEFSQPERLQPEPGSLVSGAVSIEGRVLPVIDLAACLHAGDGNEGAWVIVGSDDREWAIPVRAALDIVEIPASVLEDAGGERGGFVRAIANVGERLMSLLSLAPLAAAGRA